MNSSSLQLLALSEQLAIARLEPNAAIPDWANKGEFVSVTRTPDELSIVCSAQHIPADVASEGPFLRIQVCGRLEFSEIGVLASIAVPLAARGVSLFAVSSFETDHILVAQEDMDFALEILGSAGHKVSKLKARPGAA